MNGKQMRLSDKTKYNEKVKKVIKYNWIELWCGGYYRKQHQQSY